MTIIATSSLYSPVIPNDHVSDFNTSFWANLISGSITGILTGIIVGIILFYLQNKKVQNDEKQLAMLEFNKTLTVLKNKMMKSDFLLYNNKSVDCLYSNIQESIVFLIDQPIDYLNIKLKGEYKSKINILKEAISSYHEFIPIADALDNYLEDELRKNNSYNIDTDSRIIFALINGEFPDQIKSRYNFSDVNSSYLYNIMDTEIISELRKNYSNYRTEFLNKMYEIEEMLDL